MNVQQRAMNRINRSFLKVITYDNGYHDLFRDFAIKDLFLFWFILAGQKE